MKRDDAYPSSDDARTKAPAPRNAGARAWGHLVDPERPVMRGLTFATTVIALIGGVAGVVAWFWPEKGASTASTSVTGAASPTPTGMPEVRANIGDCLSETAAVARQMKTFVVDEIIKLDIRAGRDQLSFAPSGGTPNRLDQAARHVLARYQCSKEFPPGVQIGAVDHAGSPAWDFEHGTYQLVGTFALEDFGTGTGGVQWYALRQVRPEDLR